MHNQLIRVGIIGAGLFGQRHARVFSAMPGVDVTAIADLDEQKGQPVAERYSARFYTQYQDLMESADTDALVIATPDAMHYSIAMEALRTNQAILLEKPMTTDLAEAEAIYSAAMARGQGLFMLGHIHRFDPRYYGAHQRIQEGFIGQVVHVNIRRSLGRFAAENLSAGSNLIYHTAVHDIDSLRFLTGREVTRVYAQAVQNTFGPGLDAAAVLFTLEQGGICTMDTGWVIPSAAGSTLDAQWSLVGTQGVIYIDTQQQGLMTLDNSGFHFPDVFRYQERNELTSGNLREEDEHFIHCLRHNLPPRVNARDGLMSIRIADAVLKSISSGRAVDVFNG